MMPYDKDGRPVDLVVNPMSPINRITISTNLELEINNIKSKVIDKINPIDYGEGLEIVYDLLMTINPKQAELFEAILNDARFDFTEQDFFEFLSYIKEHGLKTEIAPFFNDINIFKLGEMYDKYEVTPEKFYVDGKEIENPMIAGSQYYMVLKHQPKKKLSSRSVGLISMTNEPTKPSTHEAKLNTKYGSTAVRAGEVLARYKLL